MVLGMRHTADGRYKKRVAVIYRTEVMRPGVKCGRVFAWVSRYVFVV